MAKSELSLRVAALEADLTAVKQQLGGLAMPKKSILEVWSRPFADEQDFQEIVRLGREYRESLRPREPDPLRSRKQPRAGRVNVSGRSVKR